MDATEFFKKTRQLSRALGARYPGPGCIDAIRKERPDMWRKISEADIRAGEQLRTGDFDRAAVAMREYQRVYLDAFAWYRIEYGDRSEFLRGKVPDEAKQISRNVMEIMGDCPRVEYSV